MAGILLLAASFGPFEISAIIFGILLLVITLAVNVKVNKLLAQIPESPAPAQKAEETGSFNGVDAETVAIVTAAITCCFNEENKGADKTGKTVPPAGFIVRSIKELS